MHDAGLKLYVWTVNDTDEMAYLVSLGVDSFITDNPEELAWIATPARPPLGDLDGDVDVDFDDLNILLAAYGANDSGDLDGDGDTDFDDLNILLRITVANSLRRQNHEGSRSGVRHRARSLAYEQQIPCKARTKPTQNA